eukprot:456152_1
MMIGIGKQKESMSQYRRANNMIYPALQFFINMVTIIMKKVILLYCKYSLYNINGLSLFEIIFKCGIINFVVLMILLMIAICYSLLLFIMEHKVDVIIDCIYSQSYLLNIERIETVLKII